MKTLYTCPMHLGVKENKKGRCPHCGMDLILQSEISLSDTNQEISHQGSYLPLLVIIAIIVLTTLTISYVDFFQGIFALQKTISYFMTGFFLVFSGFKLMDLNGFARGYSTYDLLAKKWFGYGYIYPFIELAFGLSMLLIPHSTALLIFEILVMGFSGIGVAIKIAKKEKFQCACLGTFLKVPLTKVTLIEDFGMVFLAFLLLILK